MLETRPPPPGEECRIPEDARQPSRWPRLLRVLDIILSLIPVLAIASLIALGAWKARCG